MLDISPDFFNFNTKLNLNLEEDNISYIDKSDSWVVKNPLVKPRLKINKNTKMDKWVVKKPLVKPRLK